MKLDADIKILIAGALILGGVVWWLSRNGNAAGVGKAVGGAAVDLITGTAVGVIDAVGGVASNVANATVTAANDPLSNPLQPLGSWLGSAAYDYTHSKAQGGVW